MTAQEKTTKPKATRAPRAKKEVAEAKEETTTTKAAVKTQAGRYIFATGRRKTAVVNIRLFEGQGDNLVNHKPLEKYFNVAQVAKSLEPLNTAGLVTNFYFTAQAQGGGLQAQAQATAHGISRALATTNEDLSKILKKNGFLTRDDRKKERKKPGLKRARRSPQWAKR